MNSAIEKETFQLQNFAEKALEESVFFNDLKAGSLSLSVLGKVFNQYYWWRNSFHQWFGLCILNTPSFGTDLSVGYVLKELAEHIQEEIRGDHHGLCVAFLNEIGIKHPACEPIIATTRNYCDSFINRFADTRLEPELSLSALAGRELVTPKRNRIIIDSLNGKYKIKNRIEFLEIHEELEVEHFEGLWDVLINTYHADAGKIRRSAEIEILNHVHFWDEVYKAIISD